MKIPELAELDSPKKMGSLYLRKHYPEFYQYLCEKYKDYPIKKSTEMIYLYYNNLSEPHRCSVCGKFTPFLDYKRGYQEFCSSKCSNNSPEVKARKEESNIKKFGTTSAAKNPEVKARIIKTYTERHGGMGNASQSVKARQQTTMEETYGSKFAMQNPDILKKSQDTLESHYGVRNTFDSQEIRDRGRKTMKERYGAEYSLQSEEIKRKARRTNLEKYGTEYGLNSEEIRAKIQQTCQEHYGVKTPFESSEMQQKMLDSKKQKRIDCISNLMGYTENGDWICRCPHSDCNKCQEKNYIVSSHVFNLRQKSSTEPCTRLLPIQDNCISGTTIELAIRNILDKHNISYIENDRTLLGGKEVDIYIPSHKLAIECNGIYWHSARKKDSQYHYDKYIRCLERGVQLMTFWEDQIRNNPDIVESIILSKLGIYEKIGGRQCEIREVSPSESSKFLVENHLQGPIHGKVYIGLYYKDELVSLMTFGKKRGALGNKQSREGEWELYRFCNKKGITVLGAASKLLHYFIEHYNPQVIESFSANDISTGDLYRKLGFEKLYCQPGSYWYIDENLKRHHRFGFTKGRLVKEGADPSLSEAEIMMSLGYTRIYDSGQTKWSLKTS
jgi:very-short-patch-repair endonuclease